MARQLDLFDENISPALVRVDLQNADIEYLPTFLSPPSSDRLLSQLVETIEWRQETLKMYGKQVLVPRLSAWHGDCGTTYSYSGIRMEPQGWTPPLSEIKDLVQAETGCSFNSVLVNLYRDGTDGVAWHSDDEDELGPNPVIASISLGATRKFQLRNRADPSYRAELHLEHGSLLVMSGQTQQCWHHQIPKTTKILGPRVNLTFRNIFSETALTTRAPQAEILGQLTTWSTSLAAMTKAAL